MANGDVGIKVAEKVKVKDYVPGQREKEVFDEAIRNIKEENRCPFCGREFVKKK